MLTKERLHELFDYQDGKLIRKIATARRNKVGEVAGCLGNTGYLRITVDGKSYLNHRLVFFMFNGRFPRKLIDHINGIKTDNRIENLREADHAENGWNTPAPRTNKSGDKGVFLLKRTGRWCARVKIRNKAHHIGYFETQEKAKEAYTNFILSNRGDFARIN